MKINEIIMCEFIKKRLATGEDLASAKRRAAKKFTIPCPSNVELLKSYRKLVKEKKIRPSGRMEALLRTRPVRSLSGIVNISVLTKPYPCPGKCLYCPTEKGIPKSYVSGEPAVERAKKLKYNPYLQVKKRIEMLESEGHPTDKIEMRIVGGTWSYYPRKYQLWFVKRCFEACNGKKISETDLTPNVSSSTSGVYAVLEILKKYQKINETAKYRIIGLSVETRPDFINAEEIKRLRELGTTMVELGVQNIDDRILKISLREHGVKEIIKATELLKNAGFKILYQMMPNLPGSTPEIDLKMFKKMFNDSRFRPDLLKIYPCALVKESPLYKLWKMGKYKPYAEKQLINLVKSIKKIIPYYVRIQRITRDIPSHSIVAGPAKISNLRQLVSGSCRCIRCREIKGGYNSKEKLYLFRQDYEASGGKEIFLSFENKTRAKLYSLLRLRINNKRGQVPFMAIIREIHTYGQLQPLTVRGRASNHSPQHKGMGKKLVREAEIITKKEFGAKKISVISGVGVRGYWKNLGYKLKDTYMAKEI